LAFLAGLASWFHLERTRSIGAGGRIHARGALERISKTPQQNDGARELDEGEEVGSFVLVTRYETA